MPLPVDPEALARFSSPKILDFRESAKRIGELKQAGKTVGLCHGGFDLLHPGQMIHFESAKRLCDVLFVSITSDGFVTSRKGTGRPVFTDSLRAYSVACQEAVDFVVVTDFKKGIEVIEDLKPSFYIKGPDFITKRTPGITAEREAIARVGGEMQYTDDPKLGTTEIIEYIKHELDVETLLVALDRDGTLILNDSFFGKEEGWKQELEMNKPVVDFLIALKTKAKCTFVGITNQTGVARRFFTEQCVRDINEEVSRRLKEQNVEIAHWEFCPDADKAYADKHLEYGFDPRYVKPVTKRKPGTAMVDDALAALGKTKDDFSRILMLGNDKVDEELAKNLGALYIDVTGKGYDGLVKEYEKL